MAARNTRISKTSDFGSGCSADGNLIIHESIWDAMITALQAEGGYLAEGEQRTEGYLKIHPQGRVPALILDSGAVITENTAILPYLGKACGLWPKDEIGEAKALSLIGLFAAWLMKELALTPPSI